MNKKINPKVTLVGAGPGDPELMTLAGIKALQNAEVVLYDALVNPEILEWATKAKKIFVGKRLGYKRFEQDEINYMLVANAYKYGHVVRLKGGDSFIFGRGSEEINFVKAFNIETKVIPGISSSTSAGVSLGIPMTERGISEGFWVITGTTKAKELSKELALAAQSKSTIVVLMGMSKLEKITTIFKRLGRGKLPVAIIQNASRKDEKSVVGTVDSIVGLVKENGLKNPAVIILGEVVQTPQLVLVSHKFSNQKFFKNE